MIHGQSCHSQIEKHFCFVSLRTRANNKKKTVYDDYNIKNTIIQVTLAQLSNNFQHITTIG